MSLSSQVITRLRSQAPLLVTVAGAAEFAPMRDDDQARVGISRPYGIVLLAAEQPRQESLDLGLQLDLVEAFTVVVGVDNSIADRGQAAAESLQAIRAEILTALHGWTVTVETEGHRLEPVSFTGGRFLDADPNVLWWGYDFQVNFYVDPPTS